MSDDTIPIGAVLEIGWGDPVEDVRVVVQQWTEDGVIVSDVNDHTQLAGYAWLSKDAIETLTVVGDDDATVRHLRAVGIQRDAEQVEHDALTAILAAAQASGVLLFFQDAEDGSDAGSVGRVLRLDDATVVFSDIDVEGRDTGDEVERTLEELYRVSWGDDYLRALTVLNGLDEA
jgi:hypothetical protein